ncbi:MAG: integrase family protein [Burkholderiales bacterium]|nr:integrase family protein [Burkholderiales bacterium]
MSSGDHNAAAARAPLRIESPTKRSLAAARYDASRGTNCIHWLRGQGIPRGFGLRITPKGARTFVLRYAVNGRKRLMAIADGAIELDEALKIARSHVAKIDSEADPLADRRQAARAPDMEATCASYVAHLKAEKAASAKGVERMFARSLGDLRSIKPLDLTAAAVRGWREGLRRTSGEIGSWRAFDFLRAAYRFAAEHGDFTPTYGADYPFKLSLKDRRGRGKDEQPRTSVLSRQQLGAFLNAVDALELRWRCFFRILVFTGLRKSEASKARLEWIEDDLIRIPAASRRKSNTEHVVHLPPDLQALVADQAKAARREFSPWLFPSTRNPQKPVDNVEWQFGRALKAAGLKGIRVHDLRRTLAAQLALRAPLSVTAKALGNTERVAARHYAHVDAKAAGDTIAAIATEIAAEQKSAATRVQSIGDAKAS